MQFEPPRPWQFLPIDEYRPSDLPPPADWTKGAKSFDEALGYAAKFPQALIGLFGSASRMLETWAPTCRASILASPSSAELMEGTAKLWPALQEPGDGILVIPRLERCFLRHHRGLRLMRLLIETVWGTPRRLIIGCDAWAWKYLCQAVEIDALCPKALTAPELLSFQVEPTTPISDLLPRAKEFRLQSYVLHTLLLHDGMQAATIPSLLPFRATQVLEALADLRDRQLAVEKDGFWRVSPAHYADIRRLLAAADFWVGDP